MNDYKAFTTGITIELMADLSQLGVFAQLVRYLNNTMKKASYGIKTEQGIIPLNNHEADLLMDHLYSLKVKKSA